ncbi:S1C family serine protease [Streptomyces antarcticus]|uniref:S1C family serine protease n=1 Tax=Streptomyces antarcticus TaxID=2996458 RepID=UPI00226DF8F9|nr:MULTISPECIES: trypsin-like peptidase domain-containing protein [unclassified Streptomyces]MCY0942635.1 trypsin-like peptidase domain-containing protein [Streptomyces sp. H34-AA3]MCZ4081381.1 trypsin-like peptidase domain-containing protein [Streptomyces sp. H34-S5]
MSNENEGTAAPQHPAAPSVPPAPASETQAGAPQPQPASAPVQQPAFAPVPPVSEPATRQFPPTAPPGTEPTQQIPPAPAYPAPAYGQAPAPAYDQAPQGQDYGQSQGQGHYGQGPAQGSAYGQGPGSAHGADGWPPPPPTVPAYSGGGHGGGWGAPLGADGTPPPKPKGKGGLIAGVLVAALLAGGIGGGVGYWAADRSNNGTGSTTISAGNTPKDLKREAGSIAGLASGALPSVVTIEASAGDGEGGTGTGFVYDQQGHILTNNHVVASAANGGKLSATFSDGKKYEAEVVGRAQGYDVAVLKLKNPPAGLKPLPLGDSEKVAVGDSTIAIGAPFGLSNTVTTGIVSAKNRPVASGDGSGGKNSYMSALQTDASINPGNSGGPLLDGRGAVIGINSAIQSAGNGGFGGGQAGSIGLGFAIPINQAKNVAESLIKTGQPVYPVILVSVDLQAKVAGAKISEQGAPVNELVDPNGPAGKAGLKPGDLITEFGGKPVDSGPTLISMIWTYKPGDTVKLTYQRGGKPNTVDITLGSRVGDK